MACCHFDACHHLIQRCSFVNWTPSNQNPRNFLKKKKYFQIQSHKFESVIWKMAASLFRPQCAQIIRMHMFAPANTWTNYLCLKRNYYSGHPYDCITWPAMTALLPDAHQQSTDVTGRWMGPKTGSTRNGSDVNRDPKHQEHSKYNSKKP